MAGDPKKKGADQAKGVKRVLAIRRTQLKKAGKRDQQKGG